jgi:hypothetical protein
MELIGSNIKTVDFYGIIDIINIYIINNECFHVIKC